MFVAFIYIVQIKYNHSVSSLSFVLFSNAHLKHTECIDAESSEDIRKKEPAKLRDKKSK